METLTKVEVRLISPRALQQAMDFRNENATSLAERTERLFGGKKSNIRPISRQIIGHLLRGDRRKCSPNTAAAIERALDVPSGSLFTLGLLHDSQNTERAA